MAHQERRQDIRSEAEFVHTGLAAMCNMQERVEDFDHLAEAAGLNALSDR